MFEQIILIHPYRSFEEQNPLALLTLFTLVFSFNEPDKIKEQIVCHVKDKIQSKECLDVYEALRRFNFEEIFENRLKESVLRKFGSETWDKHFLMCKKFFSEE